ncbi:DEAD/DEAH box helicase [Acidithiobacillus ferrooxidans]|uniref:ATP-dependent helicase n=1 Tax=Acidithiobacillus ferrooxidans TaxID=920 RepID=A0A2W1K566_ACIFR|nr:DEAD/DEAH box helicase [Acidithiobacillus ferrooxidans]MBU2816184.1 DEAD/DEAH box helicase [Acidithiobacillus ferrooxidans]MCR1341710.1 DEAD/DEAH box helicase [Acidithiobacillus ferrooxidans]PZD81859.1 ATP-dependent helicase [Acidithiobacillus ferrooxidans]QLK41851.1 DEAD/DEAH box helicase [Acidithiobacillus ferrooxidans]QZT53806.1 DEAD/DEAH box helicase [Acidithiobacillus ferrooxidans]
MAAALEEMRTRLQLPPTTSASLWRGMYSDGLRLGLWVAYEKFITPASKEVVKKHGFAWLGEKKIWVGPLRKARAIIEALYNGWPDGYPVDQGFSILGKALQQPEPFWAMAVRPRLVQQRENGPWLLSFPYDPTTIDALKRSRQAEWKASMEAWSIPGEKEEVLALLENIAIPERYISVRGFDEPFQLAPAAGGWTPYLVGVDEDDAETERVKLQVEGAEMPLESSLSAEEKAKLKAMEDAKAKREEAIQRAFYEPMALLPVEESVIEDLAVRCSLMAHQKDGVRHFLTRTSALNGDDMGLGKTRQTISSASHLPGGKVIVCPASLKDNWSREIKMVIPDAEPFIFENILPDMQPEWLIVNYERLNALLASLDTNHDWKFVVATFDEAHYLKEPSAQRTKASFDLAGRAERKWLLTATPMLNRPEETWTLLRLSGHPAGDIDLKEFSKHFSKSRNDRKGLGDRISEWMIRRLKDDVLTLEGKYHQEPLLSPSEDDVAEYQGFMDDDTLIPLQKINLARQWLERVKRGPILEMLGDLQPDAKAIIFCNFTQTADWFMDQLSKGSTARITGNVSRKKRTAAEMRFQNDPACRWFIGNIDAAGVGLNLTAATYVFFVSRPWTPAKLEQAEDRAYRIGQGQRVEICTPTIPDTIDDQIKALLDNKQEITSDVLVGALQAGKRKQAEETDAN